MQSIPPCPECGGRRALFDLVDERRIALAIFKYISIKACVCVNCGHITQHAHPKDMEHIREAAKKQGIL